MRERRNWVRSPLASCALERLSIFVRWISVFTTFYYPLRPSRVFGFTTLWRLLWWPTPYCMSYRPSVLTPPPVGGNGVQNHCGSIFMVETGVLSLTRDNAGWTVTMCEWQCSQVVRNSDFCLATSSGSLRYWATLSSGCETIFLLMHDVSRTAAMDN